MRRLICCFVIMILLSVAVLPVSAKGNTYQIPEMDMTIEIPSSYDVFTLDMDEDDPLFAEYGYTKSEIEAQFSLTSTYLNAVSRDGTEEIVITANENSLNDFTEMDDAALLSIASGFAEESEKYGLTVTEYDIYHHPQLKFICLYFNDGTNTACGLNYCTVVNNTALRITMYSYDGIIRVSEEKELQTVADSIVLHSYNAVLPGAESTDSFLFTDLDTGAKFYVPENWEETSFYEGVEFFDTQFSYAHGSGFIIGYGSTDLWERMSPSEKGILSRSYLSTENMSESDAAKILGVPSVKKVTYHDIEYYSAEVTSEAEVFGSVFSVTSTNLIRLENGWLYMFYFSGTEDDPHYADFEQLVSSVQYPDAVSEEPDYILSFVLGAVTVGIIVIVLLLVFLLRIRKKKQASAFAVPMKQTVLFCRECGKRLDANSRFCSECGTQVVEVGKEAEQ